MPTPDSQPNASQITNAVESGMIVAASTLRPEQPDREQRLGQPAGDRLERLRRIGGAT